MTRETEASSLPQGPFDVILADPPWSYRQTSPTVSPRSGEYMGSGGAAYYYDTMTTNEITALPVSEISAKDSVLFLWATVPLLPEALIVMHAWGFSYKTMLTWHKLRCKGMGYWFRGHTEHLLLGVRGDVPAFKSQEMNSYAEAVKEHSRKPEHFRRIIERACDGVGLVRRVELFARRTSPGWVSWGNQVDATDPHPLFGEAS